MINGQEFQCISCELSVEKAAYGDPGSVKCVFYGAPFELALERKQKSIVKELCLFF